MPIGLNPERLPSELEAAFPGRFVTAKPKKGDKTNPDALINAGVFIPPTDDEE